MWKLRPLLEALPLAPGAVKEHPKDVKDFGRQAERGKDPSLKERPGKMLPTLREHLREIENISAKVLAQR